MHLSSAPISVIATDLDGTLLRNDSTISPRTRTALDLSLAAGIGIVLVTARPPRRVLALVDKLGVDGLAICTNGALVYDLTNRSVLRESKISAEGAQQLVLALRAAIPGCCFAVEIGLRYGQEPDYAIDSPHDDADLRLGDALALCAEGVTKLIVRHRAHPLDDLVRLASEVVGDLGVVTHSGAPFVEVSAPGVTKATALAALCADLQIPAAEVLACGDMPNDLPMLAWAGWAVAVANAHPAVLAAADLITASNEEDGVARVIEAVVERLVVRSR